MLVLMFFAVVAAIGVVLYWYKWRFTIRAARTRPAREYADGVRARLTKITLPVEQRALDLKLAELRETELGVERAAAKARQQPVPVPASPAQSETTESVISRIADALGAPAVAISVAGGEQLFTSLAESVAPNALDHVSEAARILWDDGIIQAAMASASIGLPAGLLQYASNHAIHNVLAEHALSIDAVADIPIAAAQHLHDAAAEVGHAFDPTLAHAFHFPIVTFIRSTIHETSLVLDDRLSVARAAVNIAVTTGATAAGGFGGMKAGAVVGAAVGGPPGAAIGAIIGAVAGAMGGGAIAHNIKTAPLKQAAENLERIVQQARQNIQISAHEFAQSVNRRGDHVRVLYEVSIDERPKAAMLCAMDAEVSQAARDLALASAKALREQMEQAERELSLIERLIPETTIWHRLLGLDVASDIRQIGATVLADIVASLAKLLNALPDRNANPYDILTELSFAQVPVGAGPSFHDATRAIDKFLERYSRAIAEWLAKITMAYKASVAAVVDVAKSESERHHSVVQSWQPQIETAYQVVVAERRALGID